MNNWKIDDRFDIFYFSKKFLDTNIHNLPGNLFQAAIFSFYYMGLVYFRNNDVTPLNLVIRIIL